MKKKCKCGKQDWEWQLDDNLRSWIKCKQCGDNVFDDGVGVILINWDFTTIDYWDMKDVLIANKFKDGLLSFDKEERRGFE